ncbi:MAG TPA: hypothetical protein VNR87_10385 [Flavisolibacter sp.]|nr:hypothetical protein [Flavisolibacter sp.]
MRLAKSKRIRLFRFVALSSIALALFAPSCKNPSGKGQKTAATNAADTAVKPFTGTLQELYMTKQEFLTMKWNTQADYKKLVFEFYFGADSSDGSPTLVAHSAKENNKTIAPDLRYLHFNGNPIALGDNFFFGTLQIDVSDLKPFINRSDCGDRCGFYFKPVNDGHPYYKVSLITDLSKILKSDKDSITLYSIDIGSLNPSPPYGTD